MLGVINNPEMENRVQVILMVTGIGASTLEDALVQVEHNRSQHIIELPKDPARIDERNSSQPAYAPRVENRRVEEPSTFRLENMTNQQSLEIPAFLRKRT